MIHGLPRRGISIYRPGIYSHEPRMVISHGGQEIFQHCVRTTSGGRSSARFLHRGHHPRHLPCCGFGARIPYRRLGQVQHYRSNRVAWSVCKPRRERVDIDGY